MYSVICKFNNSSEETIYSGSLANCIETALNEVLGYIGYQDGYCNHELSLRTSHPYSTQLKPIFYCIPCRKTINTFRIYRHNKNVGYIFSEHIYTKIATVKVVRSHNTKSKKREATNFIYHIEWQLILDEMIADSISSKNEE